MLHVAACGLTGSAPRKMFRTQGRALLGDISAKFVGSFELSVVRHYGCPDNIAAEGSVVGNPASVVDNPDLFNVSITRRAFWYA